jgi:hypothetical protein
MTTTVNDDVDDGVVPGVRRGLFLMDFSLIYSFFVSLSLERVECLHDRDFASFSPVLLFRFSSTCRHLSLSLSLSLALSLAIYISSIAFIRVKLESDLIDCRDVISLFIANVFCPMDTTRMHDGNFEREGSPAEKSESFVRSLSLSLQHRDSAISVSPFSMTRTEKYR